MVRNLKNHQLKHFDHFWLIEWEIASTLYFPSLQLVPNSEKEHEDSPHCSALAQSIGSYLGPKKHLLLLLSSSCEMDQYQFMLMERMKLRVNLRSIWEESIKWSPKYVASTLKEWEDKYSLLQNLTWVLSIITSNFIFKNSNY